MVHLSTMVHNFQSFTLILLNSYLSILFLFMILKMKLFSYFFFVFLIIVTV